METFKDEIKNLKAIDSECTYIWFALKEHKLNFSDWFQTLYSQFF